jgi:hypothetical protein
MSPRLVHNQVPRRQQLTYQHAATVDPDIAPLSPPPTAPTAAPLPLTTPLPAATTQPIQQQQEQIPPSTETHQERERETNKEGDEGVEEDDGFFEDPLDSSGPYPDPLAASNGDAAITAASDDHGLSKPSALSHSAADAKMLRGCSLLLLY